MFKINKSLLLGLMLLSLAAAPVLAPQVMAAQPNGFSMTNPPAGISNTSLAGIIINVTDWVLGFITIVAVLMLIWGGIQYLTAAGDEGAVEKAKHTITYAVLGLIVVGIAYAIVQVVVMVFIQGNFS